MDTVHNIKMGTQIRRLLMVTSHGKGGGIGECSPHLTPHQQD